MQEKRNFEWNTRQPYELNMIRLRSYIRKIAPCLKPTTKGRLLKKRNSVKHHIASQQGVKTWPR
jgi:hypothetical protein